MSDPWEDHVRRTHQLTVFIGEDIKKSWGEPLALRVLNEWNAISNETKLGVTLVRSNDPPAKDGRGANVRFDATPSEGRFFNHAGLDLTTKLDTRPGHVNGRCARPTLTRSDGDRTWKAFVFVPANPISDDKPVGDNVKIAIALHEFIHACGVDENQPGHQTGVPGEPDDLFRTNGVIVEGDQNHVFCGGAMVPNGAGKFIFTLRTQNMVRALWPTTV
jgi:hypothetical protein